MTNKLCKDYLREPAFLNVADSTNMTSSAGSLAGMGARGDQFLLENCRLCGHAEAHSKSSVPDVPHKPSISGEVPRAGLSSVVQPVP